jgi:hypothetical protein
VVFLVATLVPLGGGVVLLGIGVAFLVARLSTGRYGYAVPAGLLLGLGAFVSLSDGGVLPSDGGWPVAFLGLGFLAIYPMGGRLGSYWPVIPGAILTALGLVQVEAGALAPLVAYAGLARYWPIGLILLGLWVLAGDVVPPMPRQIIGVVLAAALVLSVVLALAASMAASEEALPGTLGGPLATVGQTTTLTAPIAAGQPLRIANTTGGSTRVIAGDGGQVRVQVTQQVGWGPPAAVDLVPANGGVTLEARGVGSWPTGSRAASLVVEAPRDVPIAAQSSSGDVVVDDRAARVQVESSSGNVAVSRVNGPADLRASSGSLRVADVTGDVNLLTSSGSIDGTGLRHVRAVQTSSGSIRLSGTFGDNAQIRSSSGGVTVRFAADRSTRVSVTTSSGGISTATLALVSVEQSPHRLVGTLGAGAGTLTITTSSGEIRLDALR